MEEVGDLSNSPPVVRRGRTRRANQAAATNTEDKSKKKNTRTTRSVIDDLQWSAPSSPVTEDSKEPLETSAGGTFDPSLWQDFGSAFHTAFSLLGGGEDLPLTDAATVPDFFLPADPQLIEKNEVPDNLDDTELTQPAASDSTAERQIDNVILISSQEEDSDEMTLLQIKEQLASSSSSQGGSKTRGGKGGRGKAKARGRGRGRGRGKGKARGRGRAVELQSILADNEDDEDDVIFVNTDEQQLLHEESIQNEPHNNPEMESTSTDFDITLNAALQSASAGYVVVDSDFNQSSALTHGQFADAPDETEREDQNQGESGGETQSVTESGEHDSSAMCFVCSQTHIKRFMICCNSCQEWFHSACVGISETQDWKIEEKEQDYMCLTCTTTRQTIIHLESQLEPDLSFPECLTLSPPDVGSEQQEEQQQVLKEAVLVKEKEEEREAVETRPEGEPAAEPQCGMESSFPLCTGPGCANQALPDSVYCGTDCIVQHAAITLKTLSSPKVPKSDGRPQRRAAAAKPAKGQSSCRTSKRLARKVLEDADEAGVKEDHTEQEEPSASPKTCDPSLTDVQSTSIPSSNLDTTSDETREKPETEVGTISLVKQTVEPPLKQPPQEKGPQSADVSIKEKHPKNSDPEKEPESTDVSNQPTAPDGVSAPPTLEKSNQTAATPTPLPSAIRVHEMGALIVKKTTYVIPKKQPASQSASGQPSQKVSSVSTLLNETRNLLVPPAPSAPSSRPSQPNNQVRQSIQRTLTSILFKRVSDCDDLEMPESEVVKLVAGIEKEMFDIFRTTDSKYMNKYRTIMFNLKDPRNKGLLYRVVNGEIGPFRLVRMTQKDMQATKAPEPTTKEPSQPRIEAAKETNMPKPEAVKIDLASLNPARTERKPESMEQKKILPSQPSKAKGIQPGKNKKMPDILSCMLKDTTKEHKAHLFDLKCKICTGQIQNVEDEEPAKKKVKVSTSTHKTESSWRKLGGDESPLFAPPDMPEIDSPTSSPMEPSPHIDIDSPKLTIVESPASPVMESPTSPTLESPASPMMESPASPTAEGSTLPAPKRSYTPVVIPTVSTVTITRRDPRTAANRLTASLGGNSSLSNITTKQTAPYSAIKGPPTNSSTQPPSIPPPKALPKSILMKPSSSTDPRLYGASSRTAVPQTPADGDTAPFLAKQGILWKGFLNMLTVAKFMTKGYLVSGPAENLKADLPDTIQIGGRILPETVWDYVEKLKTSVTKELCVIRFHPATEEEEVAYVSLFSYFSSRGRFGVVANISRSIKDVYLVPLGANESIPSILQPFEGPGLEKNRPNLILGLAITQKLKRPASLPQEVEEKKLKVNISKDPMWIPKPPVLYGSDTFDISKPYDPEMAGSYSPPGSPTCIESPSDLSSSGSVPKPPVLGSIKENPSVSAIAATESPAVNDSGKSIPPSNSNKTPLQTILKTLFKGKESDPIVSSDGNSPKTDGNAKKKQVFSKVSGSMVDPIVQQYGQKSKVKKVEEEKEEDFDRPYDPEEEYDAAKGYIFTQKIPDNNNTDDSELIGSVEDDVAYDPEDETIFEVFQGDAAVTKLSSPNQSADIQISESQTPISDSTPTTLKSNPTSVLSTLPTGTVVVSAATLSEQQRMLEELNRQIEEQKRQLKEQEEVLRQQREAVGMFMAHFSVSDTLMSPPTKALPHSQLPTGQCGERLTVSKPADKPNKVTNNAEIKDTSAVKSETVRLEHTTVSDTLKDTTNTLTEQIGTNDNVKDCEKYSSAGEIEDSDVAYDPEDESLFDEIQDDVFKGGSTKTSNTSLKTRDSYGNRSASPNSHPSRRRRSSPKRRSRREMDHRSPSRRSQGRSHSHSRRHRDKDRHRKSERDRSRHRTRDPSEYSGHHRKARASSRHSHRRGRSSSSPRRKQSASLSPIRHRVQPSQVTDKTKNKSAPNNPEPVKTSLASPSMPSTIGIKSDPDEHKSECKLLENPVKDSAELIQNVKTELSEPSISQYEIQTSSFSSQENRPSLQETWFQDKFESKIPLREIDPPLRDSPESPDPEPQFSKPSSTENVDFQKTDLPSGLNIQGSVTEGDDTKDCENGMIQTDLKEQGIGVIGPDMQYVMTNVLGPKRSLDDHGTPMMGQAACLQGPVLSLIKNPNPNINDTQATTGDSERRKQVQGAANLHVASGIEKSSIRMETPDQLFKKQLSDKALPGSRDSVSTMPHHNPSITGDFSQAQQNINYNREALPFLKTGELRSNINIYDSKSGIMKIETAFGGERFEGGISHSRNLGSHIAVGDKAGQSASLIGFRGDMTHLKHTESVTFKGRGLGERESQTFRGDANLTDFQENRDSPDPNWRGQLSFQTSEDKGLGPADRHLGSDAPKSDAGDAHKGAVREVIDSVRAGPFTQDDWTTHQFGKMGSNMESQGPQKVGDQSFHSQRNKEVSPNRKTFEHDFRVPRGSDFMGARTEVRNPELHFTRNDVRHPVCSDMMDQAPEKKDSEFEVTMLDRREQSCPDVERLGPKFMGPQSDIPEPKRSGPGCPDFMGQRLNKRMWPERTGPDILGPGIDRRVPNMGGPVNAWRGRGGPILRLSGPEKRDLSMEVAEHHSRGQDNPEFRQPGHTKGSPAMENTGSQSRASGGPFFPGQGPESRCSSIQGPVPDRRGPSLDCQNSDWEGSMGHENCGPGSERKGTYLGAAEPLRIEEGKERNIRGRGRGRIGPQAYGEDWHIRDSWPERAAPNIKQENSRSPPRGSSFRCPEQERTTSEMGGLQPDRNMSHLEERNRIDMGGVPTCGMGQKFYRRPDHERRVADYGGQVPDRQNPRGTNFRKPVPAKPYSGIEDQKPNWRESSGPDFEGPRQEEVNTEGLGYERENEWVESEPIQDFHDYEISDNDRRGRSFRPPRLMRRNVRRPGPNSRGTGPNWRGGAFEGKRSDRRGPGFEDWGRGGSSGDIWDNSEDRSFANFQDGSDEQVEESHRQDDYTEWEDAQDSENVQFPVSGDDWDGPAFSAPGSAQDNTDLDYPGPNGEGEGHEWTEPDGEGSGVFFRGRGSTCNRRQNWGRVRGRGRGSAMQRHENMEDDWRHQDFKGNMRGHDVGIPRTPRGGFNLRRSHPNRRPFKRGGPNLRCPKPGYRNFNEFPESDGRALDFGEQATERHGVDGDHLRTDYQGFEHEFKRVRRGPVMRQQGPGNTEITGMSPNNMGPREDRRDTNSERGPGWREQEQRHRGQPTSREGRGPHQQNTDTHEGPPAPFKRPPGPFTTRGGKSIRDFDTPQQQAAQPQRHRGALLPTPSECPLPQPNTMMKSRDDSTDKTPQFGPPFGRNRGIGRGRAVDNRFRGRGRGRGGPAW
ncbi:PREDICTED: death-inducer obliterator 1 isoform X2 [Cyprinodon variegatus]|nr:PREDICTED: death-inducer obliterator 1 isoform X2 [Cyprinodon variegatus]XP_015239037.1 PREDICTED: death-inducer obliterator 1 isoform X2 [Cyprinodon variegatus]